MDARTAKYPTFQRRSGIPLVEGRKLDYSRSPLVEGRKLDYSRSLSHGHGGKMFRYFTFESLSLLVCLTVSLGILPLILPPLPPPPFLLLLIPICILALLVVLAFMPSNIWDATYAYV